jgi:tetratricopeptide (TPR) repeat protein
VARPKQPAKRPSRNKRKTKPAAKSKSKPKPKKPKGATQFGSDLVAKAVIAVARGNHDEAVALLHAARPFAKSKAARRELQRDWQTYAQRFMWSQDWVHSARFFEGALEVYREGDDTELTAELANDLGYVLQQLGRLDEAEQHSRRALALHEAAERWGGVAGAYDHLSGVMFERGMIGKAVELAREAVAMSNRIGARSEEVSHLYSLARALYEQGNTSEANDVSVHALPLAEQFAYGGVQGAFVNLIANVALDDNRASEAETHYNEARRLFRQAKLKNHEAITIANLGNVAWDRGRLDEALALYKTALGRHKQAKDPRSQAIVLTDRAGVLAEQGHFDEAHRLLEQALAIMVRLGHIRRVSFVRDMFGKLAEARGELEEARAHYAETEMSFESIGDTIQIARMLLAAAGLQADLGDAAGAETLLARAAALDPAIAPEAGAPLDESKLRAGTAAVRVLRELATARIEVARARHASGADAQALRASAAARLAKVEHAEDSFVGRSAEVRRVARRLRAALDRS